MIQLETYYRRRFPQATHATRDILWKTLSSTVFQRYIEPENTVIDIGAGYCEFINNIKCKTKYAVDINPDVKQYAHKNVSIIATNAHKIPAKYNGTADILFMSNFLEHLENNNDVLKLLVKIKSLLKPGGRLIVLQPNIDLVRERYWDFFDHHVIFNTESIREVFEICGYTLDEYVVRFLPYSTKNTILPIHPLLIQIYLKLPQFMRPFAGQSLIVASIGK